MLLPQTAEYALRATLHIAARQAEDPGGWIRVGDLADATGLPRNYLAKTLHQLARAGVLASSRGPTGGFRLAVPADRLTLADVVAVFGGIGQGRCLLGTGPCGHDPDCPVHVRWRPIATRVASFFATTTIADVSPAAAAPQDPLAADLGAVLTLVAGSERARRDFTSPPSQPRRPARQESTP